MFLRFGDFFVRSFDVINDLRLHVAAGHFLALSWFLTWLDIDPKNSVEYAFFSTSMLLSAYLLNRFTDYEYDLIADRGLAKAPRKIYLLLAAMFLVVGLSFAFSRWEYLVLALLGMVFGWFYSVPTFFRYPLKHYLVIKNLIAAGSKYVSAVGGALVFSDIPLPYLLVAGINFLFIHVIYEVLWDVRDMESDRQGKVRTIPNTYGKGAALSACVLLALLGFFIGALFRDMTDAFVWKYALTGAFIFLTYFVSLPRYFHSMIYANVALRFVFVNHEVVTYLRAFF